MTTQKISIGKAIDQVVDALSTLDTKEQRTVIATVCSLLDLSPTSYACPGTVAPAAPPNSGQLQSPAAARHDEHPHKHGLDIRTLKEQKQPDSARQMACVVAYYLLDHAPDAERKQTISSVDIEKYFKQAGYKLPSKLEQLLIDCKKSGYFEAVARGEYKLTRVGYNLVTHSMPKGAKV